ncbi:MAG: NAD-dependent epimerase/dehydratase family protein [Alphaproteobacteria bacterium]|nr:NAD-dependent epimerase/dehydratase family protein [Alphaproteobacteria bacterium]
MPDAPPVLVTGAAGFIGFHLCRALLAQGRAVIGVDDLNAYYDVALKEARLRLLQAHAGFSFHRLDLGEGPATEALFTQARPGVVIHLAAQAGVRWSVEHPHAYIHSNLVAWANVLEGCRQTGVGHLLFASSSSVYGDSGSARLTEDDDAGHPVSLYAATKRSGELMGHAYADLHGLPVTAMRFFTVYGPWGRPDMALFLFTEKILAGEPIQVFNRGEMYRGFTYVDDAVAGVLALMDPPPAPDPSYDPRAPRASRSRAPFRAWNIGSDQPVKLLRLIELLEEALGVKAKMELRPMQLGDVVSTCADVSRLREERGVGPRVGIEEGVRRFVDWYRGHHG